MTIQSEVLDDSRYTPYLDCGFVGLVDSMGSDADIASSARVSYGKNSPKTPQEDRNLIRYLIRHQHTSPFEMAEVKFHLKIPIFVMRQLVRHRTASLNEYSGRYSTMSNDFYQPELDRYQSQSSDNKQASDKALSYPIAHKIDTLILDVYDHAYVNYKKCLNLGLSREIARIQLPLGNYTELYFKQDLHNFFHLIKLRNDPQHAQNEIVTLSQLMYEKVKPLFPLSCEAFEDYRKNSITLNRNETNILREFFDIEKFIFTDWGKDLSEREKEELKQKINSITEEYKV